MDFDQLSAIANRISTQFPQIQLVYLFGSQASGSTGPLSDVDIAVLVGHEASSHDLMFVLENEFQKSLYPEKVDFILLNFAPVQLAYQFISKGKLLYSKARVDRIEYESNILSLYFDYLPVMRQMNQQILEEDRHERRIQRYTEALRRTKRTLNEIKTSQK